MSTGTLSILNCIKTACAIATATINAGRQAIAQIQLVEDDAKALEADLEDSATALDCVVNGAAGNTCTLPQGDVLPTLATAIAALNATSISAITSQEFTATASQTAFTLSGAPAGAAYLEVAVNGALQSAPTDFGVSGTTLTFVTGLEADDHVDTRRFSVS